MVVLTFEEHIARKIIAHYDKNWDRATEALDEIEDEICSLSENPNVDFEDYNKK